MKGASLFVARPPKMIMYNHGRPSLVPRPFWEGEMAWERGYGRPGHN